jgi:hypothetical protein
MLASVQYENSISVAALQSQSSCSRTFLFPRTKRWNQLNNTGRMTI